MKQYIVTISVMAPYPRSFEYREIASHIATASARALRQAKRELGRKHVTSWTVKIVIA